jgi:hypothetical protein
MSLNLSDMNLTPEELAASDSLSGFNLQVPAIAEAGRKKGVARWTEYAVVEDAYREDAAGGEGQDRTVLILQAKVIPGGTDDVNVGRVNSQFLRVNFGVLKGRTDTVGQGDINKEKTMTSMSMKKVKQLIVASGLDLSAGITGEVFNALFPIAANSAGGLLIGQRLTLGMKDDANRKAPSGANGQEVENFLRAPEGL